MSCSRVDSGCNKTSSSRNVYSNTNKRSSEKSDFNSDRQDIGKALSGNSKNKCQNMSFDKNNTCPTQNYDKTENKNAQDFNDKLNKFNESLKDYCCNNGDCEDNCDCDEVTGEEYEELKDWRKEHPVNNDEDSTCDGTNSTSSGCSGNSSSNCGGSSSADGVSGSGGSSGCSGTSGSSSCSGTGSSTGTTTGEALNDQKIQEAVNIVRDNADKDMIAALDKANIKFMNATDNTIGLGSTDGTIQLDKSFVQKNTAERVAVLIAHELEHTMGGDEDAAENVEKEWCGKFGIKYVRD